MVGEILKQKYKIERLLGQGASGEVYLCRNIELGNLWAVKHIHKHNTKYELRTEVNILKKLNHISLPKIADVIEDETGIYIVESYIEGTALNKLLEARGYLDEESVVSIAKQLCEVLSYLHSLKPFPIIYRDLKPHNVIITRDNRPVIIDFGISREYKGTEKKDTVIAGTPHYAAPEQLTADGISDARSDIYSLGVTMHHLLTGSLPSYDDTSLLEYNADISKNMDYIVRKCIKKNLNDRYQSVDELFSDLQNIKKVKVLNKKLRLTNRMLIAGMLIMSMISFSSVYLGAKDLSRENTAVLLLLPQILSLSVDQTGAFKVVKRYTDGSTKQLNASDIKWNTPTTDIAKINDDEIEPLKEGKTDFEGSYNGKAVKLTVLVNKPQDETKNVSINLKYLMDTTITPFAGTGNHSDLNDGDISNTDICEPISISYNKTNNTTYFTDLSKLRVIKDGTVTTLDLLDSYMDIDIVKTTPSGSVYFSTVPYVNENEEYVSEIYILSEQPQLIYRSVGSAYNISDFAFDSMENMYVIQPESIGLKPKTTFTSVDRLSGESFARQVDGSVESITIDSSDNIFVLSTSNNTILKLDQSYGIFRIFAGTENDQNFIDGVQCSFYSPHKIVAISNYIYVIDSNILRRLVLEDGKLVDTETIAGTVGASNTSQSDHGYNISFSSPSDVTTDPSGNIILSDAKGSMLWKIELGTF